MTRILHLSDTHISADGPDEDGVDAIGSLELMLDSVQHVPDLDVVVVSGDIADDGSVRGCEAVSDRVGAFAAQRGVPHVYCTGNHDDRSSFRTVFGSGHLNPDGSDRGRLLQGDGESCAAVSHLNGLRLITLDSLVPGSTPGYLGPHQIDALSAVLDEPSAHGTVLVLHHPPLELPSIPYVKDVVLQNTAELGRAIAGRDVIAILSGHLHFQTTGFLHGIPVWVGPGIVTRIDTTASPGHVRGVRGAGATVIDLDGPSAPTFHTLTARDPNAGQEVYLYDAASGIDIVEP